MSALSPVAAYNEINSRRRDLLRIVDKVEKICEERECFRLLDICYQDLLKISEQGDPEVWNAIGEIIQLGYHGGESDVEEAISWFQRAAEAGHVKAMGSLGTALQRPHPKQDFERALYWLHKAADQGNISAMIKLGFTYRANGTEYANYPEAEKWFMQAAEAGDSSGMILLAKLYCQNMDKLGKALPWFHRAAEAGRTDSHLWLAEIYDRPDFEGYDPAEAMKWYQLVAAGSSSSNYRAIIELARHYLDGSGTEKDLIEARVWIQKVIDSCSPKSEFYRDAVKFLKRLNTQTPSLSSSQSSAPSMKTPALQPSQSPSENDHDNISAALQLLGESLQGEVQRINSEGAQAINKEDYDTAQSVIDFAKRLTAFRAKVDALGKEWGELEDLRDKATPAVQQIVSKRFFGRKSSGEITPQEDYCEPLLTVLVEMGGNGKTKDVLDNLGVKMKGTLKPKDYEPHESNPKQIRWRNTAQWARNTMANEDGRMKDDSPNGIWEISDKGRTWLKKQ
jgi:restriction system protein